MAVPATDSPADDLLEREDEVRVLGDVLAATIEGAGRAVIVHGEAGIGKSRLLDRAAALGRAAGLEVLRARGAEPEQEFPFGVALALFEARVARAPEAERAALLAGRAGLAAPLLAGAAPPEAAEGDLFSLVHGLQWLTANLAERRPLLLLVDDAQWADPSTLRFLLYLAHRVADMPVALVLAVRSGEPAGQREELRALVGHPDARVLRPSLLTPGAVAALVRAPLPAAEDEFCAACAAVSGGNPFLLGELLLMVVEDAIPPTAAGAEALRDIAPEAVARSVLLRLARFPPAALAVARAVAVLVWAELDEAAAVAGVNRDDAVEATTLLSRAAVLAPGEPLAFVHPLLRTAVESDVVESERRHLRLRAARLLHERGARPERIAEQLLDAPPLGERWVVELLERLAGVAAARGTPEHAARLLARAAAEPLDGDDRARVLLAFGRARLPIDPAGALAPLQDALALDPGPGVAAAAEHALGQALYGTGQPLAAAHAYERGLRHLEGEDDGGRLGRDLAARFVALSLFDPSLREAAAPHEARVLAAREEPIAAERSLLTTLAVRDAVLLAPHEEVRERARHALAGEPDLDDELTFGLAIGALVWTDALDDALAVCGRAIERARRTGSVMAFATASFCRSTPHLHAGSVLDGIADAEQAVAHRDDGWGSWLALACGALAWGRVEHADLDGAEAALAPIADALDTMHPQFAAYPLLSRGMIHAARDRPRDALADFLEAGRRVQSPNPAALPWRSFAAIAAKRAGDDEQARTLAEEELELARRFGAPRAIGFALRATGLAVGGEEGLDRLREAVDALGATSAGLHLARALTDLGAATRRAGDRGPARDMLREALDLATRGGARAIARDARDELVLAGGRPRRDAQQGTEALTPGERRVALLAADGATNREIAEALFVTRKTVEWHLRGAYRKLGVNRREDLRGVLAAVGA